MQTNHDNGFFKMKNPLLIFFQKCKNAKKIKKKAKNILQL